LFLLIWPLFLVLAVMARVKIGKNIFFFQQRSTRNGRTFRLMKFRTMSEERDENGQLLPDEKRVIPFGSWLRSSSLDELPELLNILKGDMSIIGPRPLPPVYNDYYTADEKDRFLVRGGLLPPEILYGNHTPTWDEQLAWEAEYGRKCSLSLDINIFISTFKHLVRRGKSHYGEQFRESLLSERKK
jgi:lipopolysaccharide/colanic/teichoic acid biosynthesis glycosyltransferase